MEIVLLPIGKLEPNKGQIPGLPENPRYIDKERFDALKKSIKDAPEMLDLRELLVYPYKRKYVIIGGNMRFKACKELGYTEIPAKIIDVKTPVEKLKQYTIKDNAPFGKNDWDKLANEWDVQELTDWGMEIPDIDEEDIDIMPDGNDESKKNEEQKPTIEITFDNVFHMRECALKVADLLDEYDGATYRVKGGDI